VEGIWKQVMKWVRTRRLSTEVEGKLNAVWDKYGTITLQLTVTRKQLLLALVGENHLAEFEASEQADALLNVESVVTVPWSLGNNGEYYLNAKIARNTTEAERSLWTRPLYDAVDGWLSSVIVSVPLQFKIYMDYPEDGVVGLSCQIRAPVTVLGPIPEVEPRDTSAEIDPDLLEGRFDHEE
jgi:hypothetical protein